MRLNQTKCHELTFKSKENYCVWHSWTTKGGTWERSCNNATKDLKWIEHLKRRAQKAISAFFTVNRNMFKFATPQLNIKLSSLSLHYLKTTRIETEHTITLLVWSFQAEKKLALLQENCEWIVFTVIFDVRPWRCSKRKEIKFVQKKCTWSTEQHQIWCTLLAILSKPLQSHCSTQMPTNIIRGGSIVIFISA